MGTVNPTPGNPSPEGGAPWLDPPLFVPGLVPAPTGVDGDADGLGDDPGSVTGSDGVGTAGGLAAGRLGVGRTGGTETVTLGVGSGSVGRAVVDGNGT